MGTELSGLNEKISKDHLIEFQWLETKKRDYHNATLNATLREEIEIYHNAYYRLRIVKQFYFESHKIVKQFLMDPLSMGWPLISIPSYCNVTNQLKGKITILPFPEKRFDVLVKAEQSQRLKLAKSSVLQMEQQFLS